MAIKQKDIKILWGRSGNRCAICKTELTQDVSAVTASFTLGEQAHIVGHKSGAARSDSLLTEQQRDSYHNLILLCPTHHTEVDKNEEDWPVEKLHHIKSVHELWVSETLSKTTDRVMVIKNAIIASIVDSAVELCSLNDWYNWTSRVHSAGVWSEYLVDNILMFKQKVIAGCWSDEFDELKRATITFSISLNCAVQTYLRHACLNGDVYHRHKFYRDIPNNPDYDADLDAYNQWIKEYQSLIYQATKSANWFADVVRRDVNPNFFAIKGKFLTTARGGQPLPNQWCSEAVLLEFSENEKADLPRKVKHFHKS